MGVKAVAAEIGLEKDALHVYGAFVIQIGAAFAFRRSLASWLPWLAVLAVQLVNEYLDLFHGEEAEPQMWQIKGAVHDMINTMVLPTAMMMLARWAPGRLMPARVTDEAEEAGGEGEESERAAEADAAFPESANSNLNGDLRET